MLAIAGAAAGRTCVQRSFLKGTINTKERKDYALGRELRKGAVHRKTRHYYHHTPRNDPYAGMNPQTDVMALFTMLTC